MPPRDADGAFRVYKNTQVAVGDAVRPISAAATPQLDSAVFGARYPRHWRRAVASEQSRDPRWQFFRRGARSGRRVLVGFPQVRPFAVYNIHLSVRNDRFGTARILPRGIARKKEHLH